MKRILLAALAAVILLPGCSTLGDITGLSDTAVKVADIVTDDSTSTKGVTAGMSSSDARDVLINRDYYNAVKAVHGAGKEGGGGPQLLLDIEPLDGQPIVIQAKRFKVYAPPAPAASASTLSIAAPTQKKSTLVEVSQEARGWMRDLFVPLRLSEDRSETERMRILTDGNIRQTELVIMGTAVTGSQRLAGEALAKEPTIITVPAEPAPATP